MNKLLGFFELKDSLLPTIPWRIFDKDVKLDSNMLWTVRTAVHKGDDLNLPRCVGVSEKEAYDFALSTSKKYGENGMIIYYPYFIAEKSGTLNVFMLIYFTRFQDNNEYSRYLENSWKGYDFDTLNEL